METTTEEQEVCYVPDFSMSGVSCEEAAEAGRLISEAAHAWLHPEAESVSELETVGEEEECEVNLKDYTPEQLMARGAVASACPEYHSCDKCPLWTIDGGKRPVSCITYSLLHPAEVLKALGVEEGRYLTPEEQGKMVGDLLDKVDRLEAMNKLLADECGNLKTAPVQPGEVKAEKGMTRAECLDKAKACVTGQRETDYGKPEDNFAVIARLWTTYLDCEIDNLDVANMMILQKLGRITSGTATADSYVDIAGYAACGCEIATGGDNP